MYIAVADEPDSIKSNHKHIMIDMIINSIDTLHFHNSRYYNIFNAGRPNNAYFMSYLRYYSAKDSLEEMLSEEYQGDLKLFIQGMKDFHE